MKLKLLFIAVFTLSQSFYAQITKGLIVPKEANVSNFCCAYVPESGIQIYNKPNGEVQGRIVQDSGKDRQNKIKGIFIKVQGELEPIEHPNIKIIGDDITALLYIDEHSNFVKLQNGYWIKVAELEDKGLQIVNWMQYLIEQSPEVIGYYAKEPGLHLRENPSENSELILDLKGDLLEIKLTQEVKGLWCKVIVTKYSDHPCSSKGNFEEIKLKTYTGWIQLLSADLTPNVTYYKTC
ncbi:hypothetical protein KO529_16195 [Arenibacter algicola]|uniref:hypothetical protein n=1 Tax=Arenibacter algicola TaxID=616991 RepID=UPI001C07E513|nr:hypothetical protein [Arenibacter algicola]MBU2906337.1 hypothetical protein [Arenibacter algicola]